jgi:hypothetical protein
MNKATTITAQQQNNGKQKTKQTKTTKGKASQKSTKMNSFEGVF